MRDRVLATIHELGPDGKQRERVIAGMALSKFPLPDLDMAPATFLLHARAVISYEPPALDAMASSRPATKAAAGPGKLQAHIRVNKDPTIALLRMVETYIKRSWFDALRQSISQKRFRLHAARSKMQTMARFFVNPAAVWPQEFYTMLLRMWFRYTKLKRATRRGLPPPTFMHDARPLPAWDAFTQLYIQRERRRICAEHMGRLIASKHYWTRWQLHHNHVSKRQHIVERAAYLWQRLNVQSAFLKWRQLPIRIHLQYLRAATIFRSWRRYASKMQRHHVLAMQLNEHVRTCLLQRAWAKMSSQYRHACQLQALQTAYLQGAMSGRRWAGAHGTTSRHHTTLSGAPQPGADTACAPAMGEARDRTRAARPSTPRTLVEAGDSDGVHAGAAARRQRNVDPSVVLHTIYTLREGSVARAVAMMLVSKLSTAISRT
ncbi:hypothetical protein EON66_07980 [archaeon]|nr:MAG: hypothetical protein EON66_07980 [archaeon]